MDDLSSSLMASSDEPEEETKAQDPLAGFMDHVAQEGMPTGAPQEPTGDSAPTGGPESRDLGDLLGALMGGGGPAGSQQPGDLSGLLGALMGGGAPTGGSAPAGSQQPGDLSGLLGALMGGGAAPSTQSGGGMGDLLGALMGGSQASSSAQSPLTSIVVGLAEKLGLPPQIAELVVGFVLNKLLSGSRGAAQVASRSGVEGAFDPDMEQILTRVSSGQEVGADLLASTGMTAELAQQTGLDPEKAEASLQEVLSMLGGAAG